MVKYDNEVFENLCKSLIPSESEYKSKRIGRAMILVNSDGINTLKLTLEYHMKEIKEIELALRLSEVGLAMGVKSEWVEDGENVQEA